MQARAVLLHDGVVVATWPVRGDDLAFVERLARAQLVACRAGCVIRLRDVDDDLAGLLDLCGLAVLVGSVVEMRGEAERREEGRVEEVVLGDDPVA